MPMQLRNVKESLTTRSNSSALEIGTNSLINSIVEELILGRKEGRRDWGIKRDIEKT